MCRTTSPTMKNFTVCIQNWRNTEKRTRNVSSPDPDFQEPFPDDLKSARKTNIDAETSAAILAGFDYAVDGATYHFSYALDDQQNFSDTANVCLMKQAGMRACPTQ